jgi:hypothetical protein
MKLRLPPWLQSAGRSRLPALLAITLALAGLRLWWPSEDAAQPPAREAAAVAPRRGALPARSPAPQLAVAGLGGAANAGTGLLVERASMALDAAADPFAPLPPPAPPRVARAAAVAAEVPVAPPPPPPPAPPRLPYRFVGLLAEAGQPATVFLALGEQLIQARAGETLEGGFRLESIAARELVFLHLQRNLTVRLPVEGEPS